MQAYVYGRMGRQVEARHALQKLGEVKGHHNWNPVPMMAVIYAGMDNKEEALAWLQKAQAERSNLLVVLKVDHVYDPLRTDPRFQDVMRRVGLAGP